MATPVLTPGFAVLSDCELNTGWSAYTADTEVFKQGLTAGSGTLRTAGLNSRTHTTTTFDATGQHLRLWLNYASLGFLQTKANGGIRLFAQDTGGAIGYWYLGGIDTYDGGWVLLQVDMDTPFDSGSANRTIINRTGFTLNLTGAPRNAVNTWWDYLVRGNGMTVTGGTSGDPVLMDGIASVDASNGYGAVRKVNGVYFVNTNLTLGTASDIYFEDSNQIIVFEDQPVDSDLYKILATGAGTTSFKLTSSVIKSASTLTRFDLLLGDAGLETLTFSGNSVVNADQVRFKTGQTIDTVVFQNCADIAPTGATLTACTFAACGTVTLGSSIISESSFLNSTATALLAGSSLAGLSDTSFVSSGTGHAIEITGGTSHTLNDLFFTGYAAPQFNVPSSGDPDYPSVSLLLHMDGANGSTTFTDNSPSPKTLTVTGNTQISTAKNKFGGASGLFDGTGDYLSATNADFSFGTGDFTVEGWVNFTTLKNCGIFHIGATLFPGVTGIGFGLSNTTFRWLLYYNGTQTTASTGPTTNQWYHFAVVRSSGVTRVYVDGTATNLAPSDPANYTGQVLGIGSIFSTNFVLNGHLDDLRITKGVARYTANFTAPTEAFANQQSSSSSSSAIDVGTNAAIYVNVPSGTVTLNVAGAGDTPSIRTAGADVNVIAGLKTLTLSGVVDGSEVRIYAAGTQTELYGLESKLAGVDPEFVYTTPEAVDIVVHNVDYNYFRLANYSLGASDATLPISQVFDRNYLNPV